MAKLSERGELAAKAVQVLTKARDFLTTPTSHHPSRKEGNWVNGVWISRDHKGDAQFACAIGAVGVAGEYQQVGSATHWKRHEEEALRALAGVINPRHKRLHQDNPYRVWASEIYGFNDNGHTKYKDVIAAFDLAIEQQCKIVQEEARVHEPGQPIDSSLWTGLSDGKDG